MAKPHPLLRAEVPVDLARAEAHEMWQKSIMFFFYSDSLAAFDLSSQLAERFPALRGAAEPDNGPLVVEGETVTLFGWLLDGPAGVVLALNVRLNDDRYRSIDHDELGTMVGRLTHENRYGEIDKEWFALGSEKGSGRLHRLVTTGTIAPPSEFGALLIGGGHPPPRPAPTLGDSMVGAPPPPSPGDAVGGAPPPPAPGSGHQPPPPAPSPGDAVVGVPPPPAPGDATVGVPPPGPDQQPPTGLLDARVPIDNTREMTHRAWAAGMSFAVYGPVDPFDLIDFTKNRLPELRGRVEGGLFIVEEATFQIGGVLLTAPHGSAAMFTVLPRGQVDQARFTRVFDFPASIDDRSQQCRIALVHKAHTDEQDLIDFVAYGEIAAVEVFAPLTG